MPQRSSAVLGGLDKNYLRLAGSTNGTEARREAILELIGIALVFAQLLLIALILVDLDMQTSAFRRVVYLAGVGFVVNHFLPMRLRLPFFVLLSVGAIFLVLGGPDTYLRFWDPDKGLPRAGSVLVIGLTLIGICHLPIGFWKRAGLLLAAGGVAAAFRAGVVGGPRLAIIWPVVAALFMFRIIVYLYDLSTSKSRPPLAHSLAYFFLIPNVCCTLFPVIDSKTFCNSYYNEAPLGIYQRGVRWMGRGVIQLLIYRFIDQLYFLKATEVSNGTDLIQFLITNLFLYLKVSGQFHLIVGLLLLFGFNLPETNHRYFLASSFTDYWRRVNIYWKDFMMKVFFYPTFFKLRKRGPTQALVVATLWCFFITWVLHLYQTWWLKGSVSVTWPDTLFWLILGLLVLANSLREMRRGRQRKLISSTYTAADAAWLALRTAGTFACISLLWSLWSTPSLSLWVSLWAHADRYTLVWSVVVLVAIMLATIVFEVVPTLRSKPAAGPAGNWSPAVLFRSDLSQCAALLLAICVLAQPAVLSPLDDPRLQSFRDVLATGDSKLGNLATKGRGYYEQLTNADQSNLQLWETFMRQRIEKTYTGADPIRPVKDLRVYELIPSEHLNAYDTDFQTNRWGMRDRDYEQAKPAGMFRTALLGSSHVMGWGVQQEKTFKTIVEDRLNRELPTAAPEARFEILNFAVHGYSPLSQISVLQTQARAFNPDIVLFVAHLIDFEWVNQGLSEAVRERVPIPYEYLRQVLRDARVGASTHRILTRARLKPFESSLVEWTYRQIVEECRAMGALPVYIYLPLPYELPLNRKKVATLTTLAVQAGFIVVDLSNVFDNQNPNELILPDWMMHTNPRAHALIADALYNQLLSNAQIDLVNRARRVSAGAAHSSQTAHPLQ